MLKLGVNIDHVATIREARYRGKPAGEPDPVAAALLCESAGAHGITAHLREDRRHMLDRDVWELREKIGTRFNLEMANVASIVEIALRLKPDVVCLVPERRQELTTEGGLDVRSQKESVRESCARFRRAGIEVSLFIDPDLHQVQAAAETGAEFIELHTGAFADQFPDPAARERELNRLTLAANTAQASGLRVNAGHGLNYENVPALLAVPQLVELNIGHSVISRAITVGLGQAVREMLACLNEKDKPASGASR